GLPAVPTLVMESAYIVAFGLRHTRYRAADRSGDKMWSYRPVRPRGDGFCLPERASKPEATERNMTWTDERVERLRKLWADGLTASQIASALGGVSRNAVIGKV